MILKFRDKVAFYHDGPLFRNQAGEVVHYQSGNFGTIFGYDHQTGLLKIFDDNHNVFWVKPENVIEIIEFSTSKIIYHNDL